MRSPLIGQRLRDALRFVHLRLRAEAGQTMAEYAILLGVIAIVVIVAAVFLGGNISSIFKTTGSHL